MEPTAAPDPRTIYWLETIERVAPDWDRIRELGQQMAGLADHPGWLAFCELVQMQTDVLHASLLPPGVHTHAEYIGTTNQEFAFLRALEVPDAVRLVFEREDERQRKAAETAARTRSNQ